MIPPKDEYWLRVWEMMFASVPESTYPEPEAVGEAGAPMYTFTFLLGETVLAQLSHVAKFHAFGLLKVVRPQ